VTFQDYFARWAILPRLYYDNNQDIADMAHYVMLNLTMGGRCMSVRPIIRHPTVAALAHNFGRLKWMMGGDVCVFSPGSAPTSGRTHRFQMIPAGAFLSASSRVAQQLGPDGALAYMAYRLDAPPIVSRQCH